MFRRRFQKALKQRVENRFLFELEFSFQNLLKIRIDRSQNLLDGVDKKTKSIYWQFSISLDHEFRNFRIIH